MSLTDEERTIVVGLEVEKNQHFALLFMDW